MPPKNRRTPVGAAVLQPHVTSAITDAVMAELADHGYGRLSMEAVARRAEVGKSALYRRWPSKQDMVVAVLSEFSVPLADLPDTGSLREDLRTTLRAVHEWLTHPLFARILPDLTAEGVRNPVLADAVAATIGQPRRDLGAITLRRAIDRGELPADTNIELALDLLAAPVYWRVSVRHVPLEADYLDALLEHVLRALAVPHG